MRVVTDHPLVDGPLVIKPRESRKETVERMAADIERFDVIHDERDAVRALVWSGGYSVFDVMTCLPDAQYLAKQGVVAKIMDSTT